VFPSQRGRLKSLAAILTPLAAAGCSAPAMQEYSLAVPAQTLGVGCECAAGAGRARPVPRDLLPLLDLSQTVRPDRFRRLIDGH
jgi:hypothetical protein